MYTYEVITYATYSLIMPDKATGEDTCISMVHIFAKNEYKDRNGKTRTFYDTFNVSAKRIDEDTSELFIGAKIAVCYNKEGKIALVKVYPKD